MKKVLFISFAVFSFIACTHKATPSGSNTTNTSADKPKADASAMYASDIKPVLEAKCAPCHFPDKGGNKAALNNYDAVSKHIDDMLSRVQLDPSNPNYMPFRGKKEAVTAAEIASLKAFKAALGK